MQVIYRFLMVTLVDQLLYIYYVATVLDLIFLSLIFYLSLIRQHSVTCYKARVRQHEKFVYYIYPLY